MVVDFLSMSSVSFATPSERWPRVLQEFARIPILPQVLALAMLARLFRYHILTHHGAFYKAETGRMAALPVDPRMWERLLSLQP
jgi:hypothetical protein